MEDGREEVLRWAVEHSVWDSDWRRLGDIVRIVRIVRIVGIVRVVQRIRIVLGSNGSISLHICHKKYSVWALALKAILLWQGVDCTKREIYNQRGRMWSIANIDYKRKSLRLPGAFSLKL